MSILDRNRFPSNGWQFFQPQTGWRAPTPTSSTFNQTVALIIKHRRANLALAQKLALAMDPVAVGNELENFTLKRLGLASGPPAPKSQPPHLPDVAEAVADIKRAMQNDRPIGQPRPPSTLPSPQSRTIHNLKRAAQGTAVLLDWLTSGGPPVSQELAEKRASVCVGCAENVAGSWYTMAPAELIRRTLEARKDLHLETPYDDRLLSCDVCRCLMRLKVWVPLEHILAKTKPEIMAEFPSHCWIAKRDQ